MPVADMLVDSVENNELLSFMDGYSRYNQIKIDEIDTTKTAFRCPSAIGTFKWLVMSFGLKNASATYQRAMNAIFQDMINHFIEVYIDDIIVKSKKAEDHVEHLKKSFERMRKHDLKLNPMKYAFGVKAGNFLGFLVHQRGVEVDQNKSKSILEAKPPQSKNELQRFLGKVNYLRRFISNLAGRIGKWSLALTEFTLVYCSQKTMKGKSIIDFLAHHLGSDETIQEEIEIPVYEVEDPSWILKFDGSRTEGTASVGAEYEALMIGLEILKDLQSKNIQVVGDSRLVLRQVAGEYKCTSLSLAPYFAAASQLADDFEKINFQYVPRQQNWEANELAQIALGLKFSEELTHRLVLIQKKNHPSIMQRGLQVETFNLDANLADLIGKIYPSSSKGHNFIIVAIDLFTNWVEEIPLKKGTMFVGSEVKDFAADYGIKLHCSSPYYPQANGQAEASNKVLIKILQKMMEDNPRDWPRLLSETLWAYRTSKRTATGVSPFALAYVHDRRNTNT
ncbi:uncharacterized protein [Henckelia pumila]|uniref:uncharacterized protein n=1 Tax=Henckelia pumila TaxID=405737 RepID=UPI003C6E38B8